MASWWRSKCRREFEADFRRKSLKLREGLFLHGDLEVDIQEAKDLPDTDNFMFNIKRCFGQEKDVTDPYVAVFLDSTRIITTSVRPKSTLCSVHHIILPLPAHGKNKKPPHSIQIADKTIFWNTFAPFLRHFLLFISCSEKRNKKVKRPENMLSCSGKRQDKPRVNYGT